MNDLGVKRKGRGRVGRGYEPRTKASPRFQVQTLYEKPRARSITVSQSTSSLTERVLAPQVFPFRAYCEAITTRFRGTSQSTTVPGEFPLWFVDARKFGSIQLNQFNPAAESAPHYSICCVNVIHASDSKQTSWSSSNGPRNHPETPRCRCHSCPTLIK